MSTDFNNKAVLGKPVYVGTKALSDLPLDIRTRIETISEMELITFPYIGMMVYVKDEDKFYVVKSLKGKKLIPDVSSTYTDNYLIDEYEEFSINVSVDFPVFRDLTEANDFALTATNGDICHVQDYRTDEYKEMGINVFEESCYIDLNNTVQPIDSFSFEALNKLIDLLKDINNDINATDKIDDLKELIYDNYTHNFNELPTGDYKTQPWHPGNYNEYQIALKMTKSTKYEYIGSSYKFKIIGANYEIEDITIKNNEITEYYKVITLDSFPTEVSFYDGYHIEKVIHMCNTSNITNMKQMFMNCTDLTSINASDWDTSNVTDMSYMFQECYDLETLDLSNWDTSNVTTMKSMFANCYYALKTLDLSNWNTSNVTDMSYMFFDCKVLTTIGDISNWSPKVRYMDRMFYNCYDLTSLDVSDFDTSSITNMYAMFQNCAALESINGIQNWNISNVTDMSYMFDSCFTLTELNLSNWNTSNVTNMRQMFYNCGALTTLDVSNWNTSNVTNMAHMFNSCNVLKSINGTQNWDTSNVTNMGCMFNLCYDLITLDLSSWNTKNVTDMGGMFNRCNNLTYLDISNFDTSNATDMANMFVNTYMLTWENIITTNCSEATITRIKEAFEADN